MKTLGRFLLKKLDLYSSYSLRCKGPLLEDGWFRSFREGVPVDAEGRPLPFMTYPLIRFLEERVDPSVRVFEYGSGFSTLWWAARVTEVVACEHNPDWHARISAQAPPNARIVLASRENGDYAGYAARFPQHFEFLVIDGRDRVECARRSLECLKPSGVVIWDDIHREKYQEGSDFLRSRGFRRLDFSGLVPSLNERGHSGVFYRADNCPSL